MSEEVFEATRIRLASPPPSHCSAALDSRTAPLGVPVGDGYCQCGCGGRTTVAERTHRKYGWVKGRHRRYIRYHQPIRHRCRYLVDPETMCWEWQGRLVGTGYGAYVVDGHGVLAHRMEYERVHGPIPEDLELDHLCRNKRCVNPDHLEAVSHLVNVRRGVAARAR